MMRGVWLLVVAIVLGSIGSRGAVAADPEVLTAEQVEFFEKQVRPVLVNRCYECHYLTRTKSAAICGSTRARAGPLAATADRPSCRGSQT